MRLNGISYVICDALTSYLEKLAGGRFLSAEGFKSWQHIFIVFVTGLYCLFKAPFSISSYAKQMILPATFYTVTLVTSKEYIVSNEITFIDILMFKSIKEPLTAGMQYLVFGRKIHRINFLTLFFCVLTWLYAFIYCNNEHGFFSFGSLFTIGMLAEVMRNVSLKSFRKRNRARYCNK